MCLDVTDHKTISLNRFLIGFIRSKILHHIIVNTRPERHLHIMATQIMCISDRNRNFLMADDHRCLSCFQLVRIKCNSLPFTKTASITGFIIHCLTQIRYNHFTCC